MMNCAYQQLAAHAEAILEIVKHDSVRLAIVVLAIPCLALVADPVLASNVDMLDMPWNLILKDGAGTPPIR
jgi:hypothetical protein